MEDHGGESIRRGDIPYKRTLKESGPLEKSANLK